MFKIIELAFWIFNLYELFTHCSHCTHWCKLVLSTAPKPPVTPQLSIFTCLICPLFCLFVLNQRVAATTLVVISPAEACLLLLREECQTTACRPVSQSGSFFGASIVTPNSCSPSAASQEQSKVLVFSSCKNNFSFAGNRMRD